MAPDLAPLLLAVGPLLLAGFLRGVTGFGLLLVATPLLFALYPPKLAIAALVVPASLVNVLILWRDAVPLTQFRAHAGLYAAGAVGAVVGVVGLVVLDRRSILLIVAGYIAVFLLVQRWGDAAEHVAATDGMSVVAGSSGGLLGGTIGLSGPPVVTYLHAKTLGKRHFVGLLAAYFLLLGVVRIPSMAAAGLFGGRELLLGGLFSVPALAGAAVGAAIRPRVPQRAFELAVEGFLLLVAVNLVVDALGIRVIP